MPLRRDGAQGLTSEVGQTLADTGRNPENTFNQGLKTKRGPGKAPPGDTATMGMCAHPQATATHLTGDKPVASAAVGTDGPF